MVGFGDALNPSVLEGFTPMNTSDMEDAIKNLDHRLAAVEQILPTLVTKQDLTGAVGDTKEVLRQEIADTKRELKQDVADLRRHMDIRFEDVRDDIAKVAEGVASLATNLQSNTRTLEAVVRRLDQHDIVLRALVKRDI